MTDRENMAQAICAAAWKDVGEGWDDASDEQRSSFLDQADAALSAMQGDEATAPTAADAELVEWLLDLRGLQFSPHENQLIADIIARIQALSRPVEVFSMTPVVGSTLEEMRDNARSTDLYQKGDLKLAWVLEAKLLHQAMLAAREEG